VIFQNIMFLVGSQQFLIENKIIDFGEYEQKIHLLQEEGKTVVFCAVDGKVQLILAISDKIKDEAFVVIDYFKRKNKNVVMLTGDNKKTAQYVANKLKITEIFAELNPHQKKDKIEELKKQTGKKVAMVGDGVNDSLSLVSSDLGIAIGAGTDVVMECASMVLMRNDLRDLVSAFDISKVTFRRIKINLTWAFVFNVVAIPLAAGAFYPGLGILLPPWAAGAAMVVSSVFVAVSSLLLRYHTPPRL